MLDIEIRKAITMFKDILPLLALLLAGGSVTADVARDENAVCEVHRVAMSVQDVDCLPGTSLYLPEFMSAMRDRFPHHCRARYAEDHGYLHARRIRIHVCPACTAAHDAWESDRQKQGHRS